MNEARKGLISSEAVMRDLREKNGDLQRKVNLMSTEVERLSFELKTKENWQQDLVNFQTTINDLRQINEKYRNETETLRNQLMDIQTRYAHLENGFQSRAKVETERDLLTHRLTEATNKIKIMEERMAYLAAENERIRTMSTRDRASLLQHTNKDVDGNRSAHQKMLEMESRITQLAAENARLGGSEHKRSVTPNQASATTQSGLKGSNSRVTYVIRTPYNASTALNNADTSGAGENIPPFASGLRSSPVRNQSPQTFNPQPMSLKVSML